MQNNKTALVLIDLQKESDFGLINMDSVVTHTQKIVEVAREKQMPIIYTRHINRQDGIGLSSGEPLNEDGTPYFYDSGTENIEIWDEIAPQKEDIVIDKYRWSAFFETELDLLLKSMGVTDLIVGGVVTDGCVMTSVYDAYFRDYNVRLIEEMCTASNEGSHQAAILNMANWVYNLKIYNTDNMLKKIQGEKHHYWASDKVDSKQFTAETLKEQIENIQQIAKGEF